MASRSSRPDRPPRRPSRAGRPATGGRAAPSGAARPAATDRRPAPIGPAPPGAGARGTPIGVETGSGLDLIYGKNPVREALRGQRNVHALLVVTGEVGEELERGLPGWCAGLRGGIPRVYRVSPLELSARLKTSDHQGIAAEVAPYPYADPGEMLRSHTLLVALDEVQDPHNLGAIIRTAEAAGAGVLIPRHRAAEVTAAVVKASAGATEHAGVARVRNLAAQDYRYPTCFVVGSEGEGLGKRVASLCDVMVRLPHVGKVDSLNVSVSTGILLYEAVRQRA
jgi:23S rRNA (guanosine2251-2'-O)-methyltransferase